MKRWMIPLLSLSLAAPVLAVPPENPDKVKGMINDLETLAGQGRALKSGHDPADPAAVTACRAEHGALHDRAVALRDGAATLPQLAYRVNLTMAASAAVACVACDQGADKCDAVAPALERVRHQMNTPPAKE